MLLLSWKISHPIDDLGLCEPVVQVMAELLMADQLPVGKSQGKAGKDEKGPGGAIEMVENLGNRNLLAIAEGQLAPGW